MEVKKVNKRQLTVIDFFCGAGGFSEGFRQQGFKIVKGIDYWEPAIKTFNYNFGLSCEIKDITDFQVSIDEIEKLPDTDVILGSPPCVTFSSSNISGKADKTMGITLTQIFLRIVAVKKWKKKSRLKAWFMENVPSSIKHLASEYTFEELGLGEWAVKNKLGKKKIAIRLKDNQAIINSADYGSAQSRERVVAGEVIKKNKFIIPQPTNNEDSALGLLPWKKLKEVKGKLPRINCKKVSRKIIDPNYPEVSISLNKLTDHFYDSGLYESEWRQSKYLKTNHPYMGRMSFPENENKPSRTVTATKIGTSREAIVYKSEFNRKGNGQYRTHTIREASCLMGFPITYQFIGSEGTKHRLVGNAVCTSVSRALAKLVRKELGLSELRKLYIPIKRDFNEVNNLNTFSKRKFDAAPRRNKGSRFRRHPFKDGNITVTLSNYDIDRNTKKIGKWRTSVQYGNGDGFPTYNYPDNYHKKIKSFIKTINKGQEFLKIINNGFSEKIGNKKLLQEMYETQKSKDGLLEPTRLIEKIPVVIRKVGVGKQLVKQNINVLFREKEEVPFKQILALYAITMICDLANKKTTKQ